VSDLPTPSVARLAKARWLDARLLVGLLLVLLSVVVGAKIVAEADERVAVWAVTRDLGADTTLASADLEARSVRLDQSASRYVSADQSLEGMVLSRPVGKDELLPVAALGEAGAADQRRVVIEVDRFAAAGLDKGRVVDVYAVREAASNAEPPEPELVLAGVTVAEDIDSGGSAFGGSGSRAGVTLFVDGPDVAKVIDAVAHGTVYVVQVPTGDDRATNPAGS
jgi:hypothetical protein